MKTDWALVWKKLWTCSQKITLRSFVKLMTFISDSRWLPAARFPLILTFPSSLHCSLLFRLLWRCKAWASPALLSPGHCWEHYTAAEYWKLGIARMIHKRKELVCLNNAHSYCKEWRQMQFCSTSEVKALVQTHYRQCSDLNIWMWK